MAGAGPAKYSWGLRVSAVEDLFNDGSRPGDAPDALLIARGTSGEIVNVGFHETADIPVYLVEFVTGEGDRRVVGCFEQEIAPVE